MSLRPPWVLQCIPIVIAAVLTARAAFSAEPPDDAASYDQRGVKLAQTGDFSGAIEQFQTALRLNANYADAWYHLGLAYDQARKTDEAMAGFVEALRLQPGYLEARYMLADCCRKRGDFAGELAVLAQVVAQAPQFAEAHYNYGLALKNHDKIEPAVQELRAAVRLSPGNSKYMLALGIALAEVDRNAAVTMLRDAVRHGADSADAHYNLGLALGTDGDDAAAERELSKALELDPKHASASRALGVTLMHEGKLEQAASALRRALELAPTDAEAANNLGAVQLRVKDYSGAIETLERAVALNQSLIKAHASLAQAYQHAGRTADAQHESERVASLTAQQRSRGRAMIDVQSAGEQFKAGRNADALATLRDAIEASPDFADAYLELGRVTRDSGGDANAAVTAFRRVLSLDPERAGAHYEIGLTLERARRKADALAEYQIAVEMAPCTVEARKAIGRAAIDAGQWSAAVAQFRAVLAFEPRDSEAKRLFTIAVEKEKAAP